MAATAGCSGLPAAATECAATGWSVEAAAPMTKRSRREPDFVVGVWYRCRTYQGKDQEVQLLHPELHCRTDTVLNKA
eukprot:COSAG01_NODE_8289_length_2841_cov_9.744712_3_plen_77_part_00